MGTYYYQGCVIQSFGTFNTVKHALNTDYAYNTIVNLSNIGRANFNPKWTRFAPKSPKTSPILFQYDMLLHNSILSLLKAVNGAEIALKGKKREKRKMANFAIVEYGPIYSIQ